MNMKGWEFTGTHQPLRLVEKPIPTAKPGNVVLKTLATGLCHTDVGGLDEDSMIGNYATPVIMGHEICGEIVELGEGVEGFEIGDVVAINTLHSGDGTYQGYNRDGGYAPYTTATAAQIVKVPEGVTPAQAAVATDAGTTPYHALVRVGGIKPGMKVGIIGVGGLGQFAVRIAAAKGCEVYAATRKASAQEMALSYGAKAVSASITDFADENLDVIVDFAGAGKTTTDALAAVKTWGGKVVIVGMANDTAAVNTHWMILKESILAGSQNGDPDDLREVMDMIARGELDPAIENITFDEVPEGLDRLRKGEVNGRLVCIFD